jgi:hypothetical protein
MYPALAESTVEYRTSMPRTRELALSAAWHGGLTRSLVDVDGRPITVVFNGNWSHGFGPDFSDAMLEIPGVGLVTGAVELHHNASDWIRHGHHSDPRYNEVVLHVVSRLDTERTVRADGAVVPTALLTVPDEMLFQIDSRLPGIWSELGGDICAGDLAQQEPARIVGALRRLGDSRLHDRIVRIEGDLQVMTADTLLFQLLCDAMGYSENREPMRRLAEALTLADWRRQVIGWHDADRETQLLGLVLGCAGFLPLAPGDAHLAGLDPERVRSVESAWSTMRPDIQAERIPATAWVRARTRPANHPAARLRALATMLTRLSNDPTGALSAATVSGQDLAGWIQSLSLAGTSPLIGEDRARAIAASVMIPMAIALGRQMEDHVLEESASTAWDQLRPSGWNRPARRALAQVAGDAPLRGLGERGHQGLLKLDRDFCTPRRCYECPIAGEVVRDRITPPR